MESEIKTGQRFEFAMRTDKGFRQKAVVTQVLSNREEGIGPEADYYIAAWIEARTLSEEPKALVFVHPDDAADLGLADGDLARVTSRRGSIELEVTVSHREARGNCFIPFHFREAAANLLTIDEIDPVGKIPEFKFCAVRIEKAGG